ncbi:GWxTD domain-containing protein [Hymenobacter wooponensis]|uniref:GWxTD domain-containing protein n=1 Tax=Hymenobacter wooponensis TaxID=1525360 RepID=A0A4Z0MP42_9BACT|nr:GWxTD domain-containing protein [Hymenobacter wooponensis]TGD81200.1 GWxTD domain-containing protein [Hymenobacter wooponensis]
MKTIHSFLLLVLLSLSSLSGLWAAPRRDFAEQYRPDRQILVDSRREGDSLRLFLRFPGNNFRPGQVMYVAAWASYAAKQPKWQYPTQLRPGHFRQEPGGTWVDIALPLSRVPLGQIISVQPSLIPASASASISKQQSSNTPLPPPNSDYTDGALWLNITPARLTQSYILTDSLGHPLLRRYLRAGETFGVSSYGTVQPLQTRRYPLSSQPALPPMSNPASLAQPRTLALTDSASFTPGQAVQLSSGLYLLRAGSNSSWSGLLVEENSFPELTSADELIAPLTFLTTSAERKKLFDAPDPKKAIDKFWLDLAGGNQAVAKQLIRTYYGRVMEANRLFSAHKAGWLTDRGLLYLVMGPPESVYREVGQEQWVYRSNPERAATYTFRAKPSTFAPEHYELVRRPEYERLWYAAVEQWRKGITVRTGR